MTMALGNWPPPCARPWTGTPRAFPRWPLSWPAAIANCDAALPSPVNLSRRPDLEDLSVSNPSLEAYDELSQDPEDSDPEQ